MGLPILILIWRFVQEETFHEQTWRICKIPTGVAVDVAFDLFDCPIAIVHSYIPECGYIELCIELGDLADVIRIRPPGSFARAGVGIQDDQELEVGVAVNPANDVSPVCRAIDNERL